MSSGSSFSYKPLEESKKSFLLLRWLLIILASYLVIFSDLQSSGQAGEIIVIAALWSSNLLLTLLSAGSYDRDIIWRSISAVDAIVVSSCFYLLQTPPDFLWVGLMLVFAVTAVFRNLQVLFLSLMMFVIFSSLIWRSSPMDVSVLAGSERTLTLVSFFVVAVFYVFLAERFREEARITNTFLQEKRNAEVLAEIASILSTSLKTEEVLYNIVTMLRDVMNARDCAIVRMTPGSSSVLVVVKSGEPGSRDVDVEVDQYPLLVETYQKRCSVQSSGPGEGILAVPMVLQDSVVGAVYYRFAKGQRPVQETSIRFSEVVASTAANALKNAQLFEEVERRARTDFLTGLPNHRSFQMTLSSELGRAIRHRHPLSLLLIDLDYLKVVNDRFGHPRGDMVIRRVAEMIRATCREFDFAARYGGEEFTVILPETPLSAAMQVAERFRDAIASEHFEGIGKITASIGVANCPVNAQTKDDLIRAADQAMYSAKNAGRDRVCSLPAA